MKFKSLISAVALATVSSAVVADPITITTDGHGTTSEFNALGATNLPVTSTYINDGSISAGSEASDLVGKSLGFTDTGFGVIDTLDPLLGTSSTAGYGNDWTLDFSYNLAGVATFIDSFIPVAPDGTLDSNGDGEVDFWDAIAPTFTTGSFEFFYNNLNAAGDVINTTKVLGLDLIGAEVNGPNVIFFAEVDYSWYAGGDALVEDFFTDVGSGLSFYDLNTSAANPQVIRLRADFNVDPNLVPTCEDAACANLKRSTDLNISAVFTVPEPTSLAILGLGLLGLGFTRKKF